MPTAHKQVQVQTVLSIAGSDPSGGAGIQADLKTFTVIGVYGGAVITSLTVQNTMGVRGITVIAPELVKEQITEVLADLDVSHVKIGMVGSEATAIAIEQALENFQGEVIYDPVTQATSGNALAQKGASAALVNHLASRATVLTPNIPEMTLLIGHPVDQQPDTEAATILFDRFPRLKALILTGGHGPESTDTVTDHLFLRPTNNAPPTRHSQSHPRITTSNSHGTGCTFASAFAAYHQQSSDYLKAFEQTVSFMEEIIRRSVPYQTGKGNGPLLHHLHCSGKD
ncbi:MAG: bifunctional hydroxymethylpyrimidine kinase/phosphomethylpyrimidine kinase [Desulfobulbaceae bacterium]|nr:bifunctional hydroxymethylpyrimidine kinase/phosphomethylpyrimidine kinase [Desulfobulbaceae bacterium]